MQDKVDKNLSREVWGEEMNASDERRKTNLSLLTIDSRSLACLLQQRKHPFFVMSDNPRLVGAVFSEEKNLICKQSTF